MTPAEEIDQLIAKHPDYRGAILAELRHIILSADADIVETWKWMGSPVWECKGIICVGNIFKNKVKLVFNDGAALDVPAASFNADLKGNKWRSMDFFEKTPIDKGALTAVVAAAIAFSAAKAKK